jgi:hypothetical protein
MTAKLIKDKQMGDKIRSKLQRLFVNKVIKNNPQINLDINMNATIDGLALGGLPDSGGSNYQNHKFSVCLFG